MRVTGTRTSSTVLELRHGLMVQGMRAATEMERRMDRESLLLPMEASTLVTSFRTRSLAMEGMCGQITRPILVIGRETKCTEMEYSSGVMARSIRDNSGMTRDRVMECSPGEMVESMMVSGPMESNTEEEPSSRLMELERLDSGRTDAMSAGSMRMKLMKASPSLEILHF